MSTTQQNLNLMQGNSLQTIHEAVYASLDTYGSKTRFANYRRSNFYLLDVERHPESYCIKVAGSTRNIYDVKINETDRTIKCNCPDGAGYCRGNNTICKHSYFVLLKMLRMKELAAPHSTFFTTNQLSETEVGLIFSRINTVWENRAMYQDDFVNSNFSERYNRHKQEITQSQGGGVGGGAAGTGGTASEAEGAEGTTGAGGTSLSGAGGTTGAEGTAAAEGTASTELVGLDKFKTLEIKAGEEVCSICYCEMTEPEDLVRCPTCNKNFHEDCIKRWFQTGKSTCVMCRSPVWEEYQRLDGGYDDDIYYRTYTNLYNLMIG